MGPGKLGPDVPGEGSGMTDIKFTQYMRPDGRPVEALIDRPSPIANKANQIIDAGYRLGIEVLMTGQVSLSIHDLEAEEDVAIEVVPNGPQIPVAVDQMIREFDIPDRHKPMD